MLTRAFMKAVSLKMGRILSGTFDTWLGRHPEPAKIYELSEVATFVNAGAVGLAELPRWREEVVCLSH